MYQIMKKAKYLFVDRLLLVIVCFSSMYLTVLVSLVAIDYEVEFELNAGK